MKKPVIRQAVRHFCLECQGNSAKAVQKCVDEACALWPHRLPGSAAFAQDFAPTSGHDPQGELAQQGEPAQKGEPKICQAQRRLLLRAVRRYCLSCAASREDVRACAAREQCGLWSYRFGVRPETYRSVRERFLRPKTLSLFT